MLLLTAIEPLMSVAVDLVVRLKSPPLLEAPAIVTGLPKAPIVTAGPAVLAVRLMLAPPLAIPTAMLPLPKPGPLPDTSVKVIVPPVSVGVTEPPPSLIPPVPLPESSLDVRMIVPAAMVPPVPPLPIDIDPLPVVAS